MNASGYSPAKGLRWLLANWQMVGLFLLVAAWFVNRNYETWWQTFQLSLYERPANWEPLEIADPCRKVALGGDHALVIDEFGQVYSWGRSAKGQLGYAVKPRNGRPWAPYQETPRKVPLPDRALCIDSSIASQEYVVVLLEDGSIWHWGDMGPRYKTTHDYLKGENTDNPHRTFRPVRFLEATNAISVAVHGQGGAYLTADGRVFQWGSEPLEKGWDVGPYIWEPYEVLFPEKISWMEMVGSERIAISQEGNVYAWGQIGNFRSSSLRDNKRSSTPIMISTPVPAVEAVNGGGYFNILDREGNVWSWGSDTRTYRDGTTHWFKSFEKLPGLQGIVSIDGPMPHRDSALRADGRMIIWGDAYYMVPQQSVSPSIHPRLVDLPFRVRRSYQLSISRVVEDAAGCYWATQRWASRLRLHYGEVQGPRALSAAELAAWKQEQEQGRFRTQTPFPRYGERHTTPIYRPDGTQICAG